MSIRGYPGMHLCQKHIDMMLDDPEEVMELVRKKEKELRSRRGRTQKTP